jgi:hypothetical protein
MAQVDTLNYFPLLILFILFFVIFYILIYMYIIPIIYTSLKIRFNLFNVCIKNIKKLDNFLIFLQTLNTVILKNEIIKKLFGDIVNCQTLSMILKFKFIKYLKK